MSEQHVYFTDGRVPAAAIRPLFAREHRWQRWLDVEAALADAEAELGIIPQPAAKAIRQAASLERLDIDRIAEQMLTTSHPLMGLVSELSDAVGEQHGGWVHWGATTRNITQTGDMLVLREAHEVLLRLLADIMTALGDLAGRGADMVMAGRTHGQHALPITFGFKVATWTDEMIRHVERLEQVESRAFTVMVGGAVGNFGSLGEQGPAIQAAVARRFGLRPMAVPARSISDSLAEYVCVLGLLASTGGRIASEIYTLMKVEYGEVREPAPRGTIGSSTMPHKCNPQLADDCLAISAQIRALVPLSMEGMLHDHEANGANESLNDTVVQQATILSGDLLTRLSVILSGLELDEQRMRANLELSGGLVTSEAIMLTLGETIGRQHAHDTVYAAAQAVIHEDKTFVEALTSDPRVSAHLSARAIRELLDPLPKTGLSSAMAINSSKRARRVAARLNANKSRQRPAADVTVAPRTSTKRKKANPGR